MKARTWMWGLLAVLLASSCATRKLIKDTSLGERIWIDASSMSEEELIRRHVDYRKYTDELGTGYLVKKNKIQKFRDIMIRATGTPITLAVDAATTCSIVGVAVLAAEAQASPAATSQAVNSVLDRLQGD